jgi:hypothetical protein
MENETHTVIYTHKVRMNPEDGFGRSIGMHIEVLGRYKDKNKALEEKAKRDDSKYHVYFDVGPSWIEKEIVE